MSINKLCGRKQDHQWLLSQLFNEITKRRFCDFLYKPSITWNPKFHWRYINHVLTKAHYGCLAFVIVNFDSVSACCEIDCAVAESLVVVLIRLIMLWPGYSVTVSMSQMLQVVANYRVIINHLGEWEGKCRLGRGSCLFKK